MKEKTWHKIIIGDSRHMDEIKDDSVHLVITSPPYWQLKDYGVKNQIGFNDSYQDYIDNGLARCDKRLDFQYKDRFLK